MFIDIFITFIVYIFYFAFVMPNFITNHFLDINGILEVVVNFFGTQRGILNYSSFIELSYFLLGFIGLIAALFVVSAKNPIHRIASLVIVFTIGSFIFMLLDFYFLGLTYIIVYVGAIAILFLFVIMMVDIPSGPNDSINKILNPLDSDINRTTSFSSIEGFNNKVMNVLTIRPKNTIIQKDFKEQSVINYDTDIHNMVVYSINDQIIINNNMNTYLYKSYNIINPFSNKEIHISHGSNYEKFKLIIMFIVLTLFIPFLIIFIPFLNKIFNMSLDLNSIISCDMFGSTHIYNYINTIWAIEYKTITDISSLAITIYSAYPLALILIGISLWVVMIGIIIICSVTSSSIRYSFQ